MDKPDNLQEIKQSMEGLQDALAGIARRMMPEPKRKSRGGGTQGGTLDRAREARELIGSGETKTAACKRAGIDPRTFDRYASEIIDWEQDY